MTHKQFILGMAMLSMGLASCNNEKDYFDPDIQKKTYEANFLKAYSQLDVANTDWDLTAGPTYSISSSTRAFSRAGLAPTLTTSADWYNVEKATTLKWLQEQLVEGVNNRSKGTPFVMSMPDNSFSIVPIYQGQASLAWDLHVVIQDGDETSDVKVWSKGQNMQTSTNGTSWTNLSSSGNTLSSAYVRSKMYTLDNVPVGANIYFYLDVTVGASNYAKKGKKQSSLDHMMLALDCPRPTNIAADKQVKIIGCEDADLSGSDWDMNDVVFLIIGNPKAPEPINITQETIVQSYDKRYLMEDLGSTLDFDFNDVVVDVHAERTVKYEITNGALTSTTYGPWTQNAIVRHLGGELPFTLKIGDTVIDDIKAEIDKDPNIEYPINGWKPNENNVELHVYGKQNEDVKSIGFPKKGDVPMIIAVDPATKWMKEAESIPADWFTEK